MIYLLLIILILTLLYVKITKSQRHWQERGVKHDKPTFLLGDNLDIFLARKSMYSLLIEKYNKFPNERYVGMYLSLEPILVIRDPELIKAITVKDFDHFVDHRPLLPSGLEPLWTKNLLALEGKEWKDMRMALSPSFTSSKMRSIFSTITECVDIYMNYFLHKSGPVDIELKDTFGRYTTDVIASVAYGVKSDSINQQENDFFLMGNRLVASQLIIFLKAMVSRICPALFKALGFTIFDKKATTFLNDIMLQTIQIREEKGIRRPDMITLLLDERKQRETSNDNQNEKAKITDVDISAQAFIFFFAGFDTVSTLLTFAAYELTVNPDVQAKLQDEIDEVLKKCNGKLTYDALMKMKYMDMVISETLRLRPPATITDRKCSKSYTIQPSTSTERKVEFKPGDLVWLATNAVQVDPNYFPNPLKFDPERFNEDNKESIRPYTYLPFGSGPRICIGARLGQMEVKSLLFNLLSKFNFVRNERTQVPLKISKTTFDLRPANELWITLQPRSC